MLTLGSLFDGLGGWQLAAVRAGIKPVWSSEIEPFPMAVTKHHFPDTKQLGDITKIDVDKLEPVDIICAGSPCQDLSVAGKREGLAGERSGLFRTAVDIVHALRNRTGLPRYFVWENVPGAFSSNKGLDFKAVLEEITKTEIPMPGGNKWAEAGLVEWGGTSNLAWRTLDAQYWGVPQRRKRIFLVADFGGRSAGEILFVESSLSRDSEESREAGKGTSTTAERSIRETGKCLTPWDCQSKQVFNTDGKSPTLCAAQKRWGGITPNILESKTFCIEGNGSRPSHKGDGYKESDKMYTLNCVDKHAVAQVFPNQAYDKWGEDLPMATLKATGGISGGGSESLILTKE